MNYFRCGGGRSTHTATKIDVAKTPLASFESNASGLYIPETLAYIQATQAGTGDPSPSNIRPISGVSSVDTTRTGKNLFNPIAYSSFLQSDGKYRGAGNPVNAVKTYLGAYIGKQMTFSVYVDLTVSPSPTTVRVAANINGTTIGGNNISSGNAGYTSVTFTPQSANDYIFITFGSYGSNSFTFYDIQLELGSTATLYEQFKGDPYIKFFDGLIKGTYGYVDLSNITTFSYDGVSKRWQSTITGIYNFPSRNGDIVAEKYVADITANTGDENKMFTVGGAIYIYSTDSTTPPSGKLIYPLATPTTPTITPIEINMLQSAFGTEGTSAYIILGGTYYGGYLNVPTGVLTVLGKYLVFNSAQYYGTYGDDNAPLFYVDITGEGIARIKDSRDNKFLISNMLTKISTTETGAMGNYEIRTQDSNAPTKLYFRMDDYTSKAAIDTFLANNPLQVVAELATPQTYQLTPAQVTQLIGQNNVFCSTGDVAVKYWKID